MSIGRVEEAKKVLKKYARLANVSLELEGVKLVVGENATKSESVSISTRVSDSNNLKLYSVSKYVLVVVLVVVCVACALLAI